MENIVIENTVNQKEENYLSILNNTSKEKRKRLLKDNFIKALKDEDFAKVASELNVSDDIKSMYTSHLMDVTKTMKICNKCKGLNMCPLDVPGVREYAYTTDNIIQFAYHDCPYKEEYDKETSYLKNIYSYKMPNYIKDASFKNIYKDDSNRLEAIKYLKKYYDNFGKEKQKGLYLHGNFGCGKSYLIAALFNELAKKGIKSTIIYFPKFLTSLKASFNDPDNNFQEKFDYVIESPLLLIDDLGAENISNWSRDEVLGVILQYRMEEGLPTFFTSNLSIKELEVHLSINGKADDLVKAKRIIERIKYLADDIKMISVNRRK